MILEGFEIENWSCIKRVAIEDFPPSGIIVLHGPNGTGKSSIIQALRACLLDYKSGSVADRLKRWYPKNSADKPRVRVTFRTRGHTWRITKQFSSKESQLESLTARGAWKLEQSTETSAHEETRKLVGGKDSNSGLQQLLWLTQAEFQLPKPSEFDLDVQSQLRAVLGVLQTPLDDRFLARVKKEWSEWFRAPMKPGEKPKVKKDCSLSKELAVLEQRRGELTVIEAEYKQMEGKVERSVDLEVRSRNLRRERGDKTRERDLLQVEYEKSLTRLEAHRLAIEHVDGAEKVLNDRKVQRKQRMEAEQRTREAEREAETACRDVEEKSQRLGAAQQKLHGMRLQLQALGNARRELQDRLNEVNNRRQILTLKEQVKTTRENLRRAEDATTDLERLKKEARDRAAPDVTVLQELEENRNKATQSRADLEAAAIALTLVPKPGAAVPSLEVDGAAAVQAAPSADGAPISYSFRRRAEITIPGWGRVEVLRGSDARSLDELENDLHELDRNFAEGLAPFGVAAGDPKALDELRRLEAEKKLRDPRLQDKQHDVDRFAPRGLEPLRQELTRLEKLSLSRESAAGSPTLNADIPFDPIELEKEAVRLKEEIDASQDNVNAAQQQIDKVEREIDGTPETAPAASSKTVRAEQSRTIDLGLRQQDAVARENLARVNAGAKHRRGDLDRAPTVEQIDEAIRDAEDVLSKARAELEAAKLSEGEETIRDRLEASKEGVRETENQLADTDKEFHQIEGALRSTEGLHQKRAAIAAQVEERVRQTQRQLLESEAYDRLYGLFEECREKQFGAVMGPIQDRVLRWMRVLRIGGYESIRFNDQFLPEKLIAGGGATEWLLGEESTGTIEQIALMVRLALGSVLSTPEEPVLAILDDPLTHSDGVRLDRMRAVLRNAASGDTSSVPATGPLQIFICTCHPEWFTLDGAKIIDLSKPDVLRRSCEFS